MEKRRFKELKNLERIVEKLNRDLDAVVVEGYSDRLVMQRLGFEGKIFEAAERTLEGLVEDVSRGAERVGVLTDFDSHGKEMGREIAHELEKKMNVDRTARKKFGAQLTSTGRRDVEDIMPLFHSKEDKFVEAALDGLFFGS